MRRVFLCATPSSAFPSHGLDFSSPHGSASPDPSPCCLALPVFRVSVAPWPLDPHRRRPRASAPGRPAVDGKWQAWASWGGCSVTCGGGTQRRERVCSGPFFGGAACQGSQEDFRQCSAQRCPGERVPPPRRRVGGQLRGRAAGGRLLPVSAAVLEGSRPLAPAAGSRLPFRNLPLLTVSGPRRAARNL